MHSTLINWSEELKLDNKYFEQGHAPTEEELMEALLSMESEGILEIKRDGYGQIIYEGPETFSVRPGPRFYDADVRKDSMS